MKKIFSFGIGICLFSTVNTQAFAEYYFACCEPVLNVIVLEGAKHKHKVHHKVHRKIHHPIKKIKMSHHHFHQKYLIPATYELATDWTTFQAPLCSGCNFKAGCRVENATPYDVNEYEDDELWVSGETDQYGNWIPAHWRY